MIDRRLLAVGLFSAAVAAQAAMAQGMEDQIAAIRAATAKYADVNAALASVQLKRLPKWIARRQAFGRAFEEGIEGLPGIGPHPQPRGAAPILLLTRSRAIPIGSLRPETRVSTPLPSRFAR